MKRISPSRGLLIATCAFLLSNCVVFAQSNAVVAPAGQVKATDPKQVKADAKAGQQLKDLVKKRRTRSGWLGDGTVPERVRVIKDLAYVDNPVSDSQRLDLYIPSVITMGVDDKEPNDSKTNFSAKRKNLGKGWPLVVWVHGGGWKGGDKKGGPFRALLESGFAVASINYRLSGEAKWPAQYDDCQAALAYLSKHAGEYDIDAKHMGIWGSSAGGHLVLMLALKPEKSEHEFAGVCDWFGPTDLSRFMMRGETIKDCETMIPELLGVQGDALTAACVSASPVTYIGHNKKLPPIFIMHGKSDRIVSIRQSRLFVEKMKAAGYKDVRLDEVSGGHGYPGFGPNTVNEVVKFFKGKIDKREGA